MPFRHVQETFLPEIELDGILTDLADHNQRTQVWLDERVQLVPHARPVNQLVDGSPLCGCSCQCELR